MWWNGQGWGPMHEGWWLMPVLGLLCMLIFLYAISKIFGNGSCRRSYPQPNDQESLNSLKNEIQELRREIQSLRNNAPNDKNEDVS